MSLDTRPAPYTADELRLATPAYVFIAVFLLAFVRNDFVLIESRGMLGMVLAARTVAIASLTAAAISTSVARFRDWYRVLHVIAFTSVTILHAVVLYSRQELVTSNLLPTFVLIPVVYFALPARLWLKVVATSVVAATGVLAAIRSGTVTPAGMITQVLSYSSLIIFGTTHELHLRKLRTVEQAFRRRLADDVRFRSILENSTWQGIILMHDHLVSDINQAMEELLSRPREEIVGKPASSLYRIDGGRDPDDTGSTIRATLLGDAGEVPICMAFRTLTIAGEQVSAILVEDITDEELAETPAQDQALRTSIDSADLPLTKRQRQIAAELLQGATRHQIAETLYISEDTVKTHIAHIYKKLDVRSRVELANRIAIPPSSRL